MLSQLDIPDDQQDIFGDPSSCSDTEQTSDKTLHRVQCSWRSTQFSSLGKKLDLLHEHQKMEKLGIKYKKKGDSFWVLRKNSEFLEEPFNVPTSLPRNCYHPNYLATCTETEILVLQMKKEIDLECIATKASIS